MLYGYVRVSTDKQTVENQKLSITNYIKKKDPDSSAILSMLRSLKFLTSPLSLVCALRSF